ncbi:hypothetical protein AWN76_009155 [Rhodothermaceae bacterium RA]|nr:hypothetical protein AWN76_009155 [Rhodothermaceae bacterium RA]
MNREIAIVQRYIPHYRKPFFEKLRSRLSALGISLELIYGQPDKFQALKGDGVNLDWGKKVKSHHWYIGDKVLTWQSASNFLKGKDLIVVEQANSLLLNYLLQMRYLLGGTPLAFWGHGRNFQATKGDLLSERVKALLATRVYWWFAYNDLSKRHIEALGFNRSCITSVNNAIDVGEIKRLNDSLTDEDISVFKSKIGLVGRNTCLYIGGMYPEKRLPFLLEAAEMIRAEVPDFELILAGSGVDAPYVRQISSRYDWMHYVGPVYGKTKVLCFKVSRLLLMPGLVGLSVLDSFALATPLVTTANALHSPEIAYLEPNVNGVCVYGTGVRDYAEAVAELLETTCKYERLVKGCLKANEKYTIEKMVSRFADGVVAALSANEKK